MTLKLCSVQSEGKRHKEAQTSAKDAIKLAKDLLIATTHPNQTQKLLDLLGVAYYDLGV